MKFIKLHVSGKPILVNLGQVQSIDHYRAVHPETSPHYHTYKNVRALVYVGESCRYVDESLDEILAMASDPPPADKLSWLNRLRSEFDDLLQRKTGWGRNEVKQALEEAIVNAG